MSTSDCGTGAFERIGTLLEQLRTLIQQHDEALIRMNAQEIEQYLAAEHTTCERLSMLLARVPGLPTGIVGCAFHLRRALERHGALITKSRASAIMLRNTYSACHQQYLEQQSRARMHA